MEYDELPQEPVPVPFTEAEIETLARTAEYLAADADRREALRLEWKARRAIADMARRQAR